MNKPADQELKRKKVDTFATLAAARALGGKPAMNDAVAHGQGCSDEPVPVGRVRRILADRFLLQLGHDRALDLGDIGQPQFRVGCALVAVYAL